MKLFITLSLLFLMQTQLVFDFDHNTTIENWKIVDDVVMGGRSNGRFSIDKDGNGVFGGNVSLENNGGFSSVQYPLNMKASKDSKVFIRLKGDGKDYQFRIKSNRNTYYSYITSFKTSGDWETIVINLKDLYPSFRGQVMNMPNFTGNSIEEIVFLISNKKNESFSLLLDKIEIE